MFFIYYQFLTYFKSETIEYIIQNAEIVCFNTLDMVVVFYLFNCIHIHNPFVSVPH